MRYHVPTLRYGIFCKPESGFVDRFGGLPYGFPAERWPRCPACKQAMALLLQLEHHAERFDLGKRGRRLFVFQCADASPMGERELCWGGSDANGFSVTLVEPEKTIAKITPAPIDLEHWFKDIRIVEWLPKDDAIEEPMLTGWYGSWEEYRKISEKAADTVEHGEKVGSVPAWMQGPEPGLGPDWRMLVQFSDQLSVSGPIPTPNQIGCRVIQGEGNESISKEPDELSIIHSGWLWITEDAGDKSTYTVGHGNIAMGTAWIFGRNLNSNPELIVRFQR